MNRLRSTLLLLALAALARSADGQAYCALRDPIRLIYELFPEADSYRSIVRTVDERVRREVSGTLPFSLHFNELGRHTLYVPAQGMHPVGLVHVRSESGAWGLLEIAWALESDLRVKSFAFQRCRSRAKKEVLAPAFMQQIAGLGFAALKEKLNTDGTGLVAGAFTGLSEDGLELALVVVRSALKTIEVSRLAWKDDLETIRRTDLVFSTFVAGRSFEVVDDVYTPQASQAMRGFFDADIESGIDRQAVAAFRVFGADGALVGYVLHTPWKTADLSLSLWWNVRPDLSIEAVVSDGEWPDPEIGDAFASLRGYSLSPGTECQSAVEVLGGEVLLVSGTFGR